MIETLIGSGLYSLDQVVEDEFGGWQVLGAITDLHEREWKNQALETKSYRSGDYYRNIHRVGNSFEVLSDIGYGNIIEEIGWGEHNPPRFPAEKTIDAVTSDTEKILSDAGGRVINRIENG